MLQFTGQIKPSQNDLVDHVALIGKVSKRDSALAKSKCSVLEMCKCDEQVWQRFWRDCRGRAIHRLRFFPLIFFRSVNLTLTGEARLSSRLHESLKVILHITGAIQEWIERVAHISVDEKKSPADVCDIELGGTIGIRLKKKFFSFHFS